jgi:ribosome biogenesis protein SSF1/2
LFNVKGVEKKMKKIIKANKLPDLSKYKNFSDFFGNDH